MKAVIKFKNGSEVHLSDTENDNSFKGTSPYRYDYPVRISGMNLFGVTMLKNFFARHTGEDPEKLNVPGYVEPQGYLSFVPEGHLILSKDSVMRTFSNLKKFYTVEELCKKLGFK